MSTPESPNPFETPDPEQIERNVREQQHLLERQQEQYQRQWQEQYAAQQQWASQHWQGQNQPNYPPGYQAGYQPQYLYQDPQQPGHQQPSYEQQHQQQYQYSQQPYQYAHQYPYQYPQKPAAPGTATAALVTGIISLVVFPPLGIVALITGISALRRIKRTGAAGKGQSIAGVIMGTLTTMLTVLLIVAAVIAFAAVRPEGVDVQQAKTVSTHRAVAGHCLDVLPETERNLKYSLVPCADEHSAEIIQTRWMSFYPKTTKDELDLAAQCYSSSAARRAIDELGIENFEMFFVLPKQHDWEDTGLSNEFHCLVTPTSGSLRGSLTDGTATLEP